MNKKLMKETAKAALESEYGFKPSLQSIVLLEGSDDRKYIRFRVKDHEYSLHSYLFSDGSVWVGSGTITKES